jgi:maltose-binding protein MalE
MNITEEGKNQPKKDDLPLGTPFDAEAKKMISASKANAALTIISNYQQKKEEAAGLAKSKSNEVYTDLEYNKRPEWEDIFAEIIKDPANSPTIDSFMANLVENYNPPTRKSAW